MKMSFDFTAQATVVYFRIPGMWKSEDELVECLGDEFQIDGQHLHLDGGPAFEWQMVRADQEFPTVFRYACCRNRVSREVSRRLDRYTHNALLMGFGGSIPLAQHLIAGAAAMVRAGGIGVFIDNCAMAHGGDDWIELADNRCNPLALVYAFVNFVQSRKKDTITSKGMQVFGQRDGIISSGDLRSLEDFLRMVCSMHPQLFEGYVFANSDGRRFRLQSDETHQPFEGDPMSNPYGRWRLELVEQDSD